MRAVSSSGLAAESDVTIAQKYQQLEEEMAKLKAYAARQVAAKAARAPNPWRIRGDLRKPAMMGNLARVVRRTADEDEGAPPCCLSLPIRLWWVVE